ncbi:MAG TPA: DPP IV N-terminal domain-containing protein [Candidatus Dormibacteraeota bacterium]|nr:DPP IV N-terminal domain-containing protein [Candidatus Dormibacteraeota bacterium]
MLRGYFISKSPILLLCSILCAALSYCAEKQEQPPQTPRSSQSAKSLSTQRIYSEPSLSGYPTRGISWSPDGKQLSYFEIRGGASEQPANEVEGSAKSEETSVTPDAATSGTKHDKAQRTELWVMDASTGTRRVLISSDKLESVLPADTSKPTQATGLGRRAPEEYQWAPDGTAILFQSSAALAWFDLKKQSARILANSTSPIADPKISPDGRYVSFVREHNLWLVSVADGKERALTQGGSEEIRKGELDWVYPEELDNKTAYWWAPDSSAIAYFEMDERKVSQYPLVDFTSYGGAAEMERYPPAGGANPVVAVKVASVNGGEPRVMDTGGEADVYIPRVNWLPDSKHVAIQRLNRAQTVMEILLADANSGKSRVMLSEKDEYWINISDDLHFLHDSKRFLWSSERSGYRHLYIYDLKGQQLAQLTKGEWEVSSLDAVDEGKGMVYFTSTEKSPVERHLYRVGLDGSRFTRITRDAGTHAANMAPNAAAFVDMYSNSAIPPRQDLFRADGSHTATINENKVAELASFHLSPVEFLSVKTRDGIPLHAMMIKPPDFNPQRKYPVIVFTYGGPHAQVVKDAWGGATFLWHQLMAQKGFLIFSVDNRGSAGRGHLFEEPIRFHLGAQELSDQRDGAAYLKSLPFVDGKRIGIWGWSYGGFMTLRAMFEGAEDFKAGFAGGPVTDWHYYDTIYTERYMGLLPANEEKYREASLIKKAAHLKGELLIAHGTGDDNVHFANTLAVMNEFIEAGKYVEVLPFPGRGHGVTDLVARRVLMQRVAQFFKDNL